jgi:hypothetical protein
MNQEEIRRKVGEACGFWSEALANLTAAESRVQMLSSDLDAMKGDIAALVEDKRAAPKRERQYYRELIQSAKDRKSDLIAELRDEKRHLAERRAIKNAVQEQGRSLANQIESESGKLSKEFQRLKSEGPAWATAGMSELRRTLGLGLQFCEQQLRSLEDAFGWTGMNRGNDDVEIVPDPPFWSVLGPTPSHKSPLHLVEPPRAEPYLTEDGTTAVQTETYTVFDTVDVADQSGEMKGVIHARALLESQGRTLVLEIGGKGLADVLSLDPQNRLWITEVKATEKSSNLAEVGLMRDLVKDAGLDPRIDRAYERVLELSPQWLTRTDAGTLMDRPTRVLHAISKAIDTERDPARKEALRLVSGAYREAARNGFNPLYCHKELIQVGLQSDGDYLMPIQMMRSKMLDSFVKEVQPERIVQINVLKGSKDSEIFEPPPSDTFGSEPAPVRNNAASTGDATASEAGEALP